MKKQKGQASIEFLLVFVFAMVFIIGIVQPAANESISGVKEVSDLAKLVLSGEKLANSIEYVSLGAAGTKTTMQAIIPQGSLLECDEAGRNIVVADSVNPEKTIPVGAEFTCSPIETKEDKSPYTVTIEKQAIGTVSVIFT